MKLLSIWLFFIVSGYAATASPGPDSLRALLSRHQNEDSTRVTLLLNYGRASFFTKSDSMVYCADEALRIAKKIKWPEGIADAYQLKGVSYSYVLSDPVNALDCYHKALVANESLQRPRFEWQTLANIALIHFDQEEYSEALSYYKKAGSVLDQMEDKSGEGRLLMNVGHVYFELGDTAEAMRNYEKSLSISERTGDSLVAANVLNSMGYIYLKENRYTDARKRVTESIGMAVRTNNEVTRASALVNLSLIALETKDYPASEEYARQALALSRTVGNLQFERQAWDALQKVYERTGRFRQSLNAYRQFNLLNDSLINSEKKKEIARKEMQFQFDKRSALDQAEIRRQYTIKRAVLAGSGLLVLAGICGLILYKKRRDADKLKNKT